MTGVQTCALPILPDLLKSIRKIDYIYVDGNHTYEATIRYFNMIKPHLQTKGVMIFDDINWSEGMSRAWKEIKTDPDVTMTVDFFDLGLVFLNDALSKENFILKKSKCRIKCD